LDGLQARWPVQSPKTLGLPDTYFMAVIFNNYKLGSYLCNISYLTEIF